MSRPTNALIVDDESHVRAFMRLLLRELGITDFWEASDGAKGLEMAIQHRPQLMLLDINLPALGGLEVLTKLRERQMDTPVVICSSQSSMNIVNEAIRLGAIGYVLKHSTKDQALEALRDALDSLEEGEEDESA